MTTKQLLFILAAFAASLVTLHANAKIWRVNNESNYDGSTKYGDNYGGTAAYPVFAQVDQAVAFGIVNNGDTIHVEGSPAVYNATTITKQLVLIGPGFFLTSNPEVSNNALAASIAEVTFNSGSEGSSVIGLNVISVINVPHYVNVNVNNITIKRCRIEGGVSFGSGGLSDVYITENFFPNTLITNCLTFELNVTPVPPANLIFNNNICQKTLIWGLPVGSSNPTTFWPIQQCNNNVFDGPDNLATPNLAFSTPEFKNNILMPTNAIVNISASAGVIVYNIGTLSTQFGTADNNLVVPAITTLFVTSTSTDGAYQIATGTQANNTGSDGTDRGAFGGAVVKSRYMLSGLAAIPVIYQITTPGATSTTLPVTISARTIK